jgi:mannose-6-phosphate isomerase-like protein (cupin superfamily)
MRAVTSSIPFDWRIILTGYGSGRWFSSCGAMVGPVRQCRRGAGCKSIKLGSIAAHRFDATALARRQLDGGLQYNSPGFAMGCRSPREFIRYYGATPEANLKEITMEYRAISFVRKFGLLSEQWHPKVIAEINDYQFKVVKLQGDFIWHSHADTDEAFIVIEGDLRIDFRNGAVHIRSGEMFVVPRGIEHKPYAENEVKLLLIEPRGVLNTGDAGGDRTAEQNVWI